MRIAVVGGGPGGLYFAMLAARRIPGAQVTVFDRDPAGATFGFGIALSDSSHEFLRADDEACQRDIEAHGVRLVGQTISLGDASVHFPAPDARGGLGIERLALLDVLRRHARDAGVDVRHGVAIDSLGALPDSDVVVGADGTNSIVRRSFDAEFGTTTRWLGARIAWYGTPRPFPISRLTFRRSDHGWYWSVGYRHAAGASTFVAECAPDTWLASGMADMTPAQQLAHAQRIFADELRGAPLVSNHTSWKSLPVTRVERWSVGRHVLIGDALHSPHPSIGSGTRLSMGDAAALATCLARHRDDVPAALAAYRAEREPAKMKLVVPMERSLEWYETIGRRLDGGMGHAELVFSYMARTGRMDLERLRRSAPEFCARHEAVAQAAFAAGAG